MQSNGVTPTSVAGKVAYFGRPWKDGDRYATAIKIGETLHAFGQRSHKEVYNLIAPDFLDQAARLQRRWRHAFGAPQGNAEQLRRGDG